MEDTEAFEPAFRKVVPRGGRVEKLHSGTEFGEGPAWFPVGMFLLWSDIPRNRILRWTEGAVVSVFREPSNRANGNTRDNVGRLITCEHETRRVTRTERDGSISIVADSYSGKRLNSPNDVAVKSDGTIWFTDPPYGILDSLFGQIAPKELEGCFVFKFDPATDTLSVAADDFEMPNGIAFSADESILYVSDSSRTHGPNGAHHVRRLLLGDGGRVIASSVLVEVEPGVPDGLCADEDGNVWTSAGDGVHCYSPRGQLLGKIHLPESASNVTFGGSRNNRLFITAGSGLYSITLMTRGLSTP